MYECHNYNKGPVLVFPRKLILFSIILGIKSIEVLCIFGVVAVIVNYLVSISFVPAALSLYLEVSFVVFFLVLYVRILCVKELLYIVILLV